MNLTSSRVRRLRRRGLPRPHVPLVLQVHSAAGRRAREEDHGEPQEAHVSELRRDRDGLTLTSILISMWTTDETAFHSTFRGQSPAEADLNLLETARRCELYGTKLHSSKVEGRETERESVLSAIEGKGRKVIRREGFLS